MADTGPDPTMRRSGAQPRCVHCNALLAAGIGWCAQCYAPIEPVRPVDEPVARTEPGPAGTGSLVGGTLDPATAAEATLMLARLRDEATTSPLAPVTAALSRSGVRVAVVVGGTVVLTAVTFGLLALLGRLL